MQIQKSLKPDGLFLGAMFGGDTLFELRYGGHPNMIDAHILKFVFLERLYSLQKSSVREEYRLMSRQ